jgi:hypothetical protein
MTNIEKTFVVKLFGRFRSRYGQLWSSRARIDDDWEFIIDDWYTELSKFPLSAVNSAVEDVLTVYKDYPPTLGQLVDLCLKESGVPSEDQIIKCMINRDFNHPMVKMIYDKIGSWALSNDKAESIKSKTKSLYSDCLNKFRTNQEQSWLMLNDQKAQLALEAPIPEKIPSQTVRKSFAQRMEEYYKIAAEEKAKLKDYKVPEFDKNKINKGGEQNEAYCAYLLSVPDNQGLALPPVYAYDRQRLLNSKETQVHLRQSGYIPLDQRTRTESPRQSTERPTKFYKAWAND